MWHRAMKWANAVGKNSTNGLTWCRIATNLHFLINTCVCACACPVTESCLTLCNPMDCSLPGSSVHGILQERILEWVAISYSRGSSWPKDQTHIFCISCIDRWILYHYAPWEVLLHKKNTVMKHNKVKLNKRYACLLKTETVYRQRIPIQGVSEGWTWEEKWSEEKSLRYKK